MLSINYSDFVSKKILDILTLHELGNSSWNPLVGVRDIAIKCHMDGEMPDNVFYPLMSRLGKAIAYEHCKMMFGYPTNFMSIEEFCNISSRS